MLPYRVSLSASCGNGLRRCCWGAGTEAGHCRRCAAWFCLNDSVTRSSSRVKRLSCRRPLGWGAKLSYLRQRHRMTQIMLAAYVGGAPSQITNIEAGCRVPSLKLILAVAQLFGVRTEDLLRDMVPLVGDAGCPPAHPSMVHQFRPAPLPLAPLPSPPPNIPKKSIPRRRRAAGGHSPPDPPEYSNAGYRMQKTGYSTSVQRKHGAHTTRTPLLPMFQESG